MNVAALAYAVDAVGGLRLLGRVPPAAVVNHVIRLCERQPYAGHVRGEYQDVGSVALAKAPHDSVARPLRILRGPAAAANVAEAAGAVEDAGRALLTLIEEHGERVTERELLEAYRRADNLPKGTRDAETVARLRACASRIVDARLSNLPPHRHRSLADFWAGFNLPEKVHAYEARYIRRALIDAKGSITHAARLLGLDYHGTLQSMLDEGGRHHDLAHLRTPLEKRKKSIIGVSPAKRSRGERRVIKILHVEDYKLVAQAVRDTLEALGWKVETCADGAEAMKILASNEPYNVLIFDYDLPGPNGIESMRHARALPTAGELPSLCSRPATSNRTLGARARARFCESRRTWLAFPKR